ncbi:heparinase II/III domain-containing protein [Pedobacter rhodius]|uniref:Heparinase II/III family protein n=1 Tax=Pedobacter rhodius TaxID=3004098 RepID=A0ABT4L239_9SPHI|nr:heparinase II/III family protein [Pedobacter sp. SJ11]MCZ4225259.1 heparinase II/III family protein [Pedobacter sp. SJ11]
MMIFRNKSTWFLTLVLSIGLTAHAQKQMPRDWLIQAYNKAYPKGNALENLPEWQNEQYSNSSKSIQALPDSIKQKLVKQAEKAINYNWPSLPASLYLDYKLTGTRVNYENLQGERRKMLAHLVAGELIENKGKYIPQIVNGLWLILEESTWVAPAHIVVQKEGADLANIENPYIDLNASRTALTVATVYNMLAPKLAAYSKVINGRILYELNRRIFDPYLKYDNFWWMGFKGNAVNNWNTYVNANTLQAALLVLKPGEKLDALIPKLLRSTDNFINQYPEDGGCDEGPSYWDMAGGRLIRLMVILNQASSGKLNWSDKALLHKIGSYTYNMQIAGNYVVNFADAFARYAQNPESVYQYGLMFKDEKLKNYASFIFNSGNRQVSSDDVSDFLAISIVYQELKRIPPDAPYPAYAALPDLQVFNARQKAGATQGLFFAAKGGNNAESHNHNDVGNFIVYSNGKPVLIDAGVGVYTSKTFSSKRYELWNVQSQWHNCPTINGVQQQDGKKFAAKDFKFNNTDKLASVSMDIAHAYPEAASVEKWERTITLNRPKNEITLADNSILKAYKAPTELNFLTPLRAEIKKGQIQFETGLTMRFDDARLEAKIDEQPIDDTRLAAAWGRKIYRIRLITKLKALAADYKIVITQAKN